MLLDYSQIGRLKPIHLGSRGVLITTVIIMLCHHLMLIILHCYAHRCLEVIIGMLLVKGAGHPLAHHRHAYGFANVLSGVFQRIYRAKITAGTSSHSTIACIQ